LTTSEKSVRRHELAKCEECSLNNDEAVFVPSRAPDSGEVKLVIVGEAPGLQEAKRGIPFTGPSGKLLDTVLRGNGFRREDCYITNACLCRPKDNATPTARDVAACSERMRSEVSAACAGGAPIVALGNVAASAVFGAKVAITSFRVGPAKESPLFPGTRVVPTVHPAYVLRASDAFPTFVDDIGKANATVSVRWEAPAFRVFDEEVDACKALLQLRQRAGDVVIDIEAGAEKDIDYVHPNQYRLLCVGLCYAPGRAIVISETALQSRHRDGTSPVRLMLRQLLEDRRVRIIAHNGKFDLEGVDTIAPKATLGFDTMLASYACDERQGTHGLKYLAQEKLGAPDYSRLMKKYLDRSHDFTKVPRPVLYKYNAYDTTCTFALKDMYEKNMTSDETRVHDLLVRASTMLQHAELKGINVDLDYTHKQAEEFEGQIAELESRLSLWVDNARSPQQVKAALAQLGAQVMSTDVEALNNLLRTKGQGELGQFVHLMLQHRKATKMYGTYIKGTLKRLYQGRVHPTFLLHGTTTGRLSCRNPNLQNVIRGSRIKRMFVPAPGKYFVQADYKAIELRVMACEAKDPYLQEMLSDPSRDIHNDVASRFYGPGFTKEQRQVSKTVTYGATYGREEFSIAQQYHMPVQEAKAFLNMFWGLIPNTVHWQAELRRQILNTEDDLVTAFGRHRRMWLVTDSNKLDLVKEGYAYIPQSTASDICLSAAIELHEKYGLDVRLLVHDSILVETDKPKEVAALMLKVMPEVAREIYSDFVPFPADVGIGTSWADV
jgi:uracil-DNA glycosylase family 4